MAERRMFAKTIVLSDEFLDMPLSARCLYFTMGMLGDDDGFVNSPKSIMRQCGASEDDLKLLIAKSFVIPFDSGVVVIKHWRINNYLQKDRYTPTKYVEEKSELTLKENGAYHVENSLQDSCIHSMGIHSIDKDSIDKGNILISKDMSTPTLKNHKHKYGPYNNVLLTDDEKQRLENDYGTKEAEEAIQYLSEYIEMKGAKYKSHNLALRKWVFQALKEKRGKSNYKPQMSQADRIDEACRKLEEEMAKNDNSGSINNY